jgi:hypothetical protein
MPDDMNALIRGALRRRPSGEDPQGPSEEERAAAAAAVVAQGADAGAGRQRPPEPAPTMTDRIRAAGYDR